jgi:hypothetical protein
MAQHPLNNLIEADMAAWREANAALPEPRCVPPAGPTAYDGYPAPSCRACPVLETARLFLRRRATIGQLRQAVKATE